MNQKALAVISFGTTYTLAQDAIMQIESTLSCHAKEYDCFRAFTSKMVIAKLKREQGQYVLTPEELMEQLYQKGYKEVLCQPLHIINGFEFEKMYKALSAFTDKFDKIQIGRPLLTFEDDYKACCDIVMKYAPAPKEENLLRIILCLCIPKIVIFATVVGGQFGVGSLLDNRPLMEHDDLVAKFTGG